MHIATTISFLEQQKLKKRAPSRNVQVLIIFVVKSFFNLFLTHEILYAFHQVKVKCKTSRVVTVALYEEQMAISRALTSR